MLILLSSITHPAGAAEPGIIGGELKKWHCVTLSFSGPKLSETAEPNPFKDYRLDVVFSQGRRRIHVPGYYAADGRAAHTAAKGGAVWRVHFVPPAEGEWHYMAGFLTGPNIAAGEGDGTPLAFDGAVGGFMVGPTEEEGRDLCTKGPLRANGSRLPRFANGESFLKAGVGSPENFLAYEGFDQTHPSHRYAPHAGDWQPGDPVWRGGRGKSIIGALNYLAGKGMNSVSLSTMNARGSGRDVWPWIAEDKRLRFDCSKLDQWEIVFSQMDRLGLAIHMITQEAGNDHLLDGGDLGLERKLYYRELVARYGHHPGITWDLGNENSNTPEQLKAYAKYIRQLDPWRHPIVVGALPGQTDPVFEPLLGDPAFDGISLEISAPEKGYGETLKWIRKAERARRPWFVDLDAAGGPKTGALPDAADFFHETMRKQVLWGNLMAGGAGVEWRFGSDATNGNLTCESWRTWDNLWDLTRRAVECFRDYLPFDRMTAHDELIQAPDAHCLALPGQAYAVYLPQGGTGKLDLGNITAQFSVKWYNPWLGGELSEGSVALVRGPGRVSLGFMSANPDNEWVALVRRVN